MAKLGRHGPISQGEPMADEPTKTPDAPADALERELTTDLDDKTTDKPRGPALHTRILVGLLVGVAAGVVANVTTGGESRAVTFVITNITEPIGALFLRLLLMIVVPLVFSSLVVGVSSVGDVRKLGRVGAKTLGYTIVVSAISVVIGLGLARAIEPGRRIDEVTAEGLKARYSADADKRVAAQKAAGSAEEAPLMTAVKTLVPANPVAAAAGETPNMLHLMLFALMIGVAATLLPRSVADPFLSATQSLYEISAKVVDVVMKLAPYAVLCLIFSNMARFGLDLLAALGWFMVTVLGGLLIHMAGVYSLSVYVLARLSPLDFFRRTKTAILTAFSTSSSNATLPTALRVTEENLGVPRQVSGFVLTIGATANQNGTALYEGVTVLFLAQLAGVDLSLGQQITVVYLAILGGIGTAGVPSGSIPFIIAVLASIGVNPALIAVILGVDRILDMCRTAVNVTGDICAAAYVARSEGYALLTPANAALVPAPAPAPSPAPNPPGDDS